jgi:hypothetical protein
MAEIEIEHSFMICIREAQGPHIFTESFSQFCGLGPWHEHRTFPRQPSWQQLPIHLDAAGTLGSRQALRSIDGRANRPNFDIRDLFICPGHANQLETRITLAVSLVKPGNLFSCPS